MYYVYILESLKDGSFYFGQTQDLDSRLARHNAGLEKYTSKKTPWKILWSCAVPTRSDALRLERKLKNFKSRKRVLAFLQLNQG
jgi:putative endonuclease